MMDILLKFDIQKYFKILGVISFSTCYCYFSNQVSSLMYSGHTSYIVTLLYFYLLHILRSVYRLVLGVICHVISDNSTPAFFSFILLLLTLM